MRILYVEFERDRSMGLDSMFGDGHTDRQTHTHTHTHTHTDIFSKTHFRLRKKKNENHQKIEVENFDDCNTSFTPNVARK